MPEKIPELLRRHEGDHKPGARLKGTQTRGDRGHLMRREHITASFEVLRAIFLEDSPCCGAGHLQSLVVSSRLAYANGGGGITPGDSPGT